MRTRCPHCDHEFDPRPSGAKLAAMLGGIAGATASRRFGGALIGGLVGYALGHLIETGSLPMCPCCRGTVEPAKPEPSTESEPAS